MNAGGTITRETPAHYLTTGTITGRRINSSGTLVSGGGAQGVGNDTFPALTFVRRKTAVKISAQVLVSSSVTFGDSLGAAAETVTDLGNGAERVTIRSAINDRVQPIQFLKLRLSLAP